MTFWTQPKPNSTFHGRSVVGFERHSKYEVEIRLTHNRELLWTGTKRKIDRLVADLRCILGWERDESLPISELEDDDEEDDDEDEP